MEKKQMYQTLHCSITVSGKVCTLAQLSAHFQIKAREYGLTDSESLAVWIEGDNGKIKTYFNNRISEYQQDLSAGKTKLKNAPKNWEI